MRRRCFPLLVVLTVSSLPVHFPALAQEPVPRAAVPDPAARAKAEEQLKSQHKDAYAKAQLDTEERLRLATLLFEQARQTDKDLAGRYVCLQEARDLAVRAGNLSLALQAITELERSYAVDAQDLKAAAVAAAVAAVKTAEGGKTLAEGTLDLAADAVESDNYDLAVRLGKSAEEAARKAKSLPLVLSVQKYNRGVAAAQKQFEGLRPFIDRLRNAPEDAEANLAVGNYLCLLKGTWERGLFLLAQGSDPTLRRLAQRDLIRPDNAQEQLELGDAWWDFAEKQTDQAKVHVRQRAVFWYEQAVAGMDGLVRGRLEERIAAVPPRRVHTPGWDYSGPPRELYVLRGHTNTVFGAAFAPDGRKVLSGCINGTGILWDAGSGKQLHTLQGHGGMIWSVAYDPKGRRLLTASWDGTVKMWDAANGRELRRFPANGRIADVNGVAVSPDGKRLLTGSDDQVVRLWDVETGQELKQMRGHNSFVYGVAFSPDGRQALSGGNGDGTMILWDLQNGQIIRRFQGLAGQLRTVAFSPDGRQGLSSGENDVRLWDLKTGQEVRRFRGHTAPVAGVAFSPDGRRILSGAHDSTIRLWDTATGRELHRFTGHTGAVFSVAFSPGGGRAVSAGGDNTVRIWGLPR